MANSKVSNYVVSAVAANIHGFAGTPRIAYRGTLRGAKIFASKSDYDPSRYLKIENKQGLVAYRLPTYKRIRPWVNKVVKYIIPLDRNISK